MTGIKHRKESHSTENTNMPRMRFGFAAAAAVAATLASSARATIVTLAPTKDNTIYQSNVNNSNGAGTQMYSGTNTAASPRRGLIAFDIAGNVPAGATINSAQLTLYLAQIAGSGGGGGSGVASATLGLHALSANWGEGTSSGTGSGAPAATGDATWNARFYSPTTPTPWTNAGGDYSGTTSASAAVGTTLNVGYTWSSAALASDVQQWLNTPSSDFGWILINADETSVQTFRSFFTRESSNTALRPQLQITFTPVPEPASIVLLAAGLAMFLLLRRWTPCSTQP
jgi:hypothetical protein